MMNTTKMRRRRFLRQVSVAGGAAVAPSLVIGATAARNTLLAGEAAVDITPPVGTLLCGFHYRPGRERRVVGVRRPTQARGLALRAGDETAIVFSLDVCTVSAAFATRVAGSIEAATGVPARNVRFCATHTHSAPGGRYALQWGDLPKAYFDSVEAKLVDLAGKAVADLAPCTLHLGQVRTLGANFNRTVPSWKTDAEFDAASADEDRWLDTQLRVLSFRRAGSKPDLLWYHFCAHPVCFTGRQSGPDWPGIVGELIEDRLKVWPSFLQGHSGDVNPGDGTRWLGDPEDTAAKVAAAIERAMDQARSVPVDSLRGFRSTIPLPLDAALHQEHLQGYLEKPVEVERDRYVDDGFAKEWFAAMKDWDPARTELSIGMSLLRLGPIALFFHPSELFSYYGLRLQHESPFEDVISVGYTDGFIGYLTDPTAHQKGEYAAALVPKVLNLPPYRPEAARHFTSRATAFMRGTLG